MANRSLRFLYTFFGLLFLVVCPCISMSADDYKTIPQYRVSEIVKEPIRYIELKKPIRDNRGSSVVINRINSHVGKVLLNRNTTAYSFPILFITEGLDKPQFTCHSNIDGLHGYLAQRIMI